MRWLQLHSTTILCCHMKTCADSFSYKLFSKFCCIISVILYFSKKKGKYFTLGRKWILVFSFFSYQKGEITWDVLEFGSISYTWDSSTWCTEPFESSFLARLTRSAGLAWYLDRTSGGKISKGTTPSMPCSVNCKRKLRLNFKLMSWTSCILVF